ncbi:hypothetical protein F4604DRAFT_1774990 [Suillus subluteus]|nr:hypothetical protein F4604DRAFT_1774990 [Suillus subluteus]
MIFVLVILPFSACITKIGMMMMEMNICSLLKAAEYLSIRKVRMVVRDVGNFSTPFSNVLSAASAHASNSGVP